MKPEILVEDVQVRQAVLGFSGWPDAGHTIKHTLVNLQKSFPCEEIAVWDIEGYWHTSSMRPQVLIRQGRLQRLEWPAWRFSLCTPPSSQPVLVGMGPEPECHWRLFSLELLQMLNNLGCQEIFLLGSLMDQVLHDETTISCVVQDPEGFNRVHELGCQMVDYIGSAAVHSAIMGTADTVKMNVVSLWAHLPFYIEGPHELTMVKLLNLLGSLFDFQVDTTALMEAWMQREKEIEDSIQHDQDLNRMLESMKKQERSAYPSSFTPKVVRLDEFLKKRNRQPDEEE